MRSIWSKRVSGWKASSGEKLQVDPVGDEPAQLDAVAAERLAPPRRVLTPPSGSTKAVAWRRSGETRTSATVTETCAELGVVHLAAGEDLRQRAADHLADAQLALAGRAAGEGSCLCHAGSHPIAGGAKSRAAAEGGDGGRGRDRGGRRLRPHGPDAGARGRRDPGRPAERRHRAAGPPLDRPRPRRGDGRRRRSASSSRTTRSRSSPAARRCSTSPRRRRRCCTPSSRRRRGWCT